MSPSRGYQRLFAELKRRHVFKVAAVYGVVGFGVLEVADVFVPALNLPAALVSTVAVLVLLGFPIALVIAWAFEVTPDGIERTASAEDGELSAIASEAPTKRWPVGVAALVGTVLLLGSGWFILRSVGDARESGGGPDAETVEITAAGDLDPMKIAVLPFTNMSGDEENERFALGVHNDIHSRLTRLRNFKVISRPSVMIYKDSAVTMDDVARDLGAGSVLTGAAQKSGTRLRISVQLVDTRTDQTLWNEQYDREWSVDDLLDTQAEIAEQVAVQLDATLSEAEREALAVAPTRSPEAYDLFLESVELYEQGFETPTILQALQKAEEAVEIDPEFALAWVQVFNGHIFLYWDAYDRAPERLAAAQAALDRARELAPDLPEIQAATGRMFYHGYLAYDSALAYLEPLVESAPSTYWVLDGVGAIKRRQGRTAEAVEYFARAFELDPKVATNVTELGITYYLLRNYDTAEPLIARYMDANPTGDFGYALLARLDLTGYGDVAGAREWIARGNRAGARGVYMDLMAYRTEMYAREPQAALAALQNPAGLALGELQFMYYPVPLLRGFAHQMAGDEAAAIAAFEDAAAVLEAAIDSVPDDERLYGPLGMAYAELGRKDDAIAAASRGVELMPMSKEHWRGSQRVAELARVYSLVGENVLAINQLEFLLSEPGELSADVLRLDPMFDGLRVEPRFEALIE